VGGTKSQPHPQINDSQNGRNIHMLVATRKTQRTSLLSSFSVLKISP
jgi:hypothetical protein